MTVPWREVVDKACIEEHAQCTSNEVLCVSQDGKRDVCEDYRLYM